MIGKSRSPFEGQNIALEVRWSEGYAERIPGLVAELLGHDLDVLVAPNSPTALAAKNVTQTVPIVMFAGDPVGLGLVASLARPGRNVTGLSYFNTEVSGKRLELLKQLVPRLARVAVLKNPTGAVHQTFWNVTEHAVSKLSLALQPIEVSRPEDFEPAFAAAARSGAQALLALDIGRSP
jgi:putative tryptophan/tyrosine transport system substrate-binding protein